MKVSKSSTLTYLLTAVFACCFLFTLSLNSISEAREKKDPIISPETAGVSGATEKNLKPCNKNSIRCIKIKKKIKSLQRKLATSTDPYEVERLKENIQNLEFEYKSLTNH